MAEKKVLVPGPDHPITIDPTPGRVVVTVAGQKIADTAEALTLREAGHSPVHYLPRKDVDLTALERTEHATYCPYKGDCAYYSVRVGDEVSVNGVWTYEAPYPAVEVIKDHLAFAAGLVDQ